MLNEKPPWSKGAIERMGRSLRAGEHYDKDLFDLFMIHHARIIEEIRVCVDEALSSFLIIEAGDGTEVTPTSGTYRFSARPKTLKSSVEKLQRMETTPIRRIQDIAGLRIDFAGTHGFQNELAIRLQGILIDRGAKKAEIKDIRNQPHSGYRAVHIHAEFRAGRAEIQLRTALQAQWANLYEVAADIFGRSIRYQGWENGLSSGDTEVIKNLQVLAEEIFKFEIAREDVQGKHRNTTSGGKIAEPVKIVNDRAEEIYGMIDRTLGKFRKLRESIKESSNGNSQDR